MPNWYDIHLEKKYLEVRIRKFRVPDSRVVSISPLWQPLCRGYKQIAHVLGNDCDIVFFFLNQQKSATGNSVMFMLPHGYCHKGLGCGKMIKLTLKIFNIFGDVYTRDGTISLCQRDASAHIVMSHKVQYTSFGSIPLPLLGHQITWSLQIPVNTLCALSNEP